MATVAQIQDENFDNLYSELQEFYSNALKSKLSADNVMVMIKYSMEVVQSSKKFKKMKGPEKKKLVLEVINQFIKDYIADPKNKVSKKSKKNISIMLELAPTFIDAAVDFAKIFENSKKRFFCC
jgi:hypothetical protein